MRRGQGEGEGRREGGGGGKEEQTWVAGEPGRQTLPAMHVLWCRTTCLPGWSLLSQDSSFLIWLYVLPGRGRRTVGLVRHLQVYLSCLPACTI